jgi:alcohol dehydrogenase
MDLVIARELELLGSHGMAARAYPELLALVETGRLRPGDLVTREIGLDEAPPALSAMGEPRHTGVTVIRPHESHLDGA